jgi:hypothetical protein
MNIQDCIKFTSENHMVIFRISHGQAHFWTMENNLKPKDIINFQGQNSIIVETHGGASLTAVRL